MSSHIPDFFYVQVDSIKFKKNGRSIQFCVKPVFCGDYKNEKLF
ncbi:hypothetical protein LEP1GSC082_4100 [Leptospira kirschneri str. H2]|uniref:Uncharacterized protein n=2 Tax=Leptospira kirschneri TaxID=29507 RepID=A0A0E2B635_9LEPT|nr:hypothetical protein LEP1GSC081_2688 [Leptospira kirschneri str. H1]EKO59304.1 hypothetical protein LEP1GSC082_4100 [Leptospira kirschneri str. H2]EMK20597.1 hypothetical protein LEP1GSC008_3422 [Leptospira kirschneri serovar Bulgarica str. Nikolaevo]